jgi:hypothetical protein
VPRISITAPFPGVVFGGDAENETVRVSYREFVSVVKNLVRRLGEMIAV